LLLKYPEKIGNYFMRRTYAPVWQLVVGCALILSSWPAARAHAASQGAVQQGRELAQRVYDRPHGKDSSARMVMVLLDKDSERRVRQMYIYRRDQGHGRVQSLIRFVSPADIDGTGLLTIDHSGDETDQWIYLPALDRERRIASSRKGGRFVGSDLYYEDLRDREVAMDHQRLLGKEKVLGVMCDVLESIPVNPDNSAYSKRILWIHPQILIPLRVDYFESGSKKPTKRLLVHRVQKIQGYWTVMDSTMTDLRSGHQTRLKVDAMVYDRNLPDELFSRQLLVDPSREAAFRP
jgi:hypothetical protein